MIWTLTAPAVVAPPVGVAKAQVDTVSITVSAHALRLFVTGEAGPVVVMESGGGSTDEAWSAVVPELSKHARVVTFDRPGYGMSEPCGKPRAAERIADELRTALRAAGIEPPFVLVGWSCGGALVRVFSGKG